MLNQISAERPEAPAGGALRGRQGRRRSRRDAGALGRHARDGDSRRACKAIGRAGAGTNNIPVDGDERARRAGVQRARRQRQRGQGAGARRHAAGGAQPRAGAALRRDARRRRRRPGQGASRTARRRSPASSWPARRSASSASGKIGCLVADAAIKLGMNVLGYDPEITVDAAWSLPSQVRRRDSVNEVLKQRAFRHAARAAGRGHARPRQRATTCGLMQPGAVLLNFSREGVVDDGAVLRRARQRASSAGTSATSRARRILGHPRVIALPHLGASTREAEENCAVMVVDQLRDYLEHGNIANAVNFPQRGDGARIGATASPSPTPTCPTCSARSRPRWRRPG